MKFNLKNFPDKPKEGYCHVPCPYCNTHKKYQQWKEGFEKELRTLLWSAEYINQTKAQDLIKEILGEEQRK